MRSIRRLILIHLYLIQSKRERWGEERVSTVEEKRERGKRRRKRGDEENSPRFEHHFKDLQFLQSQLQNSVGPVYVQDREREE